MPVTKSAAGLALGLLLLLIGGPVRAVEPGVDTRVVLVDRSLFLSYPLGQFEPDERRRQLKARILDLPAARRLVLVQLDTRYAITFPEDDSRPDGSSEAPERAELTHWLDAELDKFLNRTSYIDFSLSQLRDFVQESLNEHARDFVRSQREARLNGNDVAPWRGRLDLVFVTAVLDRRADRDDSRRNDICAEPVLRRFQQAPDQKVVARLVTPGDRPEQRQLLVARLRHMLREVGRVEQVLRLSDGTNLEVGDVDPCDAVLRIPPPPKVQQPPPKVQQPPPKVQQPPPKVQQPPPDVQLFWRKPGVDLDLYVLDPSRRSLSQAGIVSTQRKVDGRDTYVKELKLPPGHQLDESYTIEVEVKAMPRGQCPGSGSLPFWLVLVLDGRPQSLPIMTFVEPCSGGRRAFWPERKEQR